MDAKIKIKEIKIDKDDPPKMAKIEDYWSEQQATKIVEYKDLKGLVEEMGK